MASISQLPINQPTNAHSPQISEHKLQNTNFRLQTLERKLRNQTSDYKLKIQGGKHNQQTPSTI